MPISETQLQRNALGFILFDEYGDIRVFGQYSDTYNALATGRWFHKIPSPVKAKPVPVIAIKEVKNEAEETWKLLEEIEAKVLKFKGQMTGIEGKKKSTLWASIKGLFQRGKRFSRL